MRDGYLLIIERSRDRNPPGASTTLHRLYRIRVKPKPSPRKGGVRGTQGSPFTYHLSSAAERRAHNPEVGGSKPPGGIAFYPFYSNWFHDIILISRYIRVATVKKIEMISRLHYGMVDYNYYGNITYEHEHRGRNRHWQNVGRRLRHGIRNPSPQGW